MRSTDVLVSVEQLGKQFLMLGAVLGLLASLLYFMLRGGNFAPTTPAASQLVDLTTTSNPLLVLCGQPPADGRPVSIEMLFSEDVQPWIEAAADRFVRKCPNIQVKLVPMQDLAAVEAILSGRVSPTIWAPADDLALRYLEYRWNHQAAALPFRPADKLDLIASPLVLLIWEDRRRVLSTILREHKTKDGQWVRSLCPLVPRVPDLTGVPLEAMVPGSWSDFYKPLVPLTSSRAARKHGSPSEALLPSLAEIKSWGQVKIGRARPTRYAAGTATLYLLTSEYVLTPNQQSVATFEQRLAEQKSAVRTWLRRCEAGLEAPLASEQELATEMFHQGPAYLDAVITYEHLALPLLDKVDANTGNLDRMALVYPEPTMISRHPAVLLNPGSAQKDAALRWLHFLRSKLMQQKAIELGLRPTISEVTTGGHDVAINPFLRLRRYGVLPEPILVEPPTASGRAIADLLTLWGDATGRK